MGSCVVKKTAVLAAIALVALAMHEPAAAADAVMTSKAPARSLPYDWGGF